MDYKIYYEGIGGVIDFSSSPFIYDTHNLFDYMHNYESTTNVLRNGTTITRFFAEGQMKSISVQVLGNNKIKHLNELEFKLNQDVVAMSPGKLYVNNQYVRCYLISSFKNDWNQFKNMEYLTLNIFIENPKWISEETIDFTIHANTSIDGGFRFPTNFPFSWKNNNLAKTIVNNHYDSVKASIIFFGPVLNPNIQIGGNIYSIKGELLDGERYEIDPFSKTILKITNSGDTFNAFHQRNKENSVFAPISPGEHNVVHNKEFSVQITLMTERNEPLWI